MQDVQRALMPDQPEHRRQVVAKDGANRLAGLLVPTDQNHAIDLLRRRATHVHRILADEQVAIVVASDHRGMLDLGRLKEQFALEPGRHFLGER